MIETGKSEKQLKLLQEFPSPSYENWMELVKKQLAEVPLEKILLSPTAEGIPKKLIYVAKDLEDLKHLAAAPGQFPYIRGARAEGSILKGWEISQPLKIPSAQQFNKAVRHDVARGLTRVALVMDQAGKAGCDPEISCQEYIGKGGLSVCCVSDIAHALKGIDFTSLSMELDAGAATLPILGMILAYLNSQKTPFEKLKGNILLDPLSLLVTVGNISRPIQAIYDEMSYLSRWAKSQAPKLQTIGIDVRPYYEGGSNAVQELAFAMATAAEYVREMIKRNLSINEIAPQLFFSFAIGSDFFMEIAKVRTARCLWAQIMAAFGGSKNAGQITINLQTGLRNKTVHDPYVNMLRTTTEAFAGVIGGGDCLSVGPFDEVFGQPDEFSRRIARNIQIIIRDECHGNKVIDPAGGSWLVESLTDQLGKKAWSLFQEIEKAGGMIKALEKGYVQDRIAESVKQRIESVNKRKSVIVGTNMYANLEEQIPLIAVFDQTQFSQNRIEEIKQYKAQRKIEPDFSELEKSAKGSGNFAFELINAVIKAAEVGATLHEMTSALNSYEDKPLNIAPLSFCKDADSYNELRKNALEFKTRTGAPPAIFLVNFGNISQNKARADFVTGFFQPGGFSVIGDERFDDIETAVHRSMASGASIIVFCSSDKLYPEVVPEFTKALKSQKPEITVVLAGNPKDHIAEFRKAGIDDFIYLGANNLEMLKKFQRLTGVSQ